MVDESLLLASMPIAVTDTMEGNTPKFGGHVCGGYTTCEEMHGFEKGYVNGVYKKMPQYIDFLDYQNTVLQTRWLKAREMHCFTVLEGGNLKSKFRQDCVLSETCRRGFSSPSKFS